MQRCWNVCHVLKPDVGCWQGAQVRVIPAKCTHATSLNISSKATEVRPRSLGDDHAYPAPMIERKRRQQAPRASRRLPTTVVGASWLMSTGPRIRRDASCRPQRAWKLLTRTLSCRLDTSSQATWSRTQVSRPAPPPSTSGSRLALGPRRVSLWFSLSLCFSCLLITHIYNITLAL